MLGGCYVQVVTVVVRQVDDALLITDSLVVATTYVKRMTQGGVGVNRACGKSASSACVVLGSLTMMLITEMYLQHIT